MPHVDHACLVTEHNTSTWMHSGYCNGNVIAPCAEAHLGIPRCCLVPSLCGDGALGPGCPRESMLP